MISRDVQYDDFEDDDDCSDLEDSQVELISYHYNTMTSSLHYYDVIIG